MNALAAAHDAAVQMIDTSVVRVHQHGSCIASNKEQRMGCSRGGLTSKIHAVVDTIGLPVLLGLAPGEAHDNRLRSVLVNALSSTLLAGERPDPVCIMASIPDWLLAIAFRRDVSPCNAPTLLYLVEESKRVPNETWENEE